MTPEYEIVALAAVLGVAIGAGDRDTADRQQSRLLLAAADVLTKRGVSSEAVEALATGIRIGLEPPPTDGDGLPIEETASNVVAMLRKVA